MKVENDSLHLNTFKQNKNKDEVLHLCRIKQNNNDNEAWGYLYLHYRNYLLKVISRFIYDHEYQENLLQDTWLKIYRNIDKYDINNKFSAWILVIAINLCKSWLKTNLKTDNNGVPLIELTDRIETYVDSNFYHEQTITFEEKICSDDLIEKAMNTIKNELHKTAFKLWLFDRLSLKKISELLNENEHTTKNWIYLSRDKVANWIKNNT